MENTKEIKEFYETSVVTELEAVLNKIKSEGLTRSVRTDLRCLQDELARLNAVTHFFDAWHEEGDVSQEKRKRA
jgi:hypothetical protein